MKGNGCLILSSSPRNEVAWVWANGVSWQRNCEVKDDVTGLGVYAFRTFCNESLAAAGFSEWQQWTQWVLQPFKIICSAPENLVRGKWLPYLKCLLHRHDKPRRLIFTGESCLVLISVDKSRYAVKTSVTCVHGLCISLDVWKSIYLKHVKDWFC